MAIKPKMSDADFSAQFGPTKAESDSVKARAARAAAASAPKDTSKSTVISGVRNPLANAMNVAAPASASSPIEEITKGAGNIAKNVADTIGRIMKHGQHRAPSEVVRGKRRTN